MNGLHFQNDTVRISIEKSSTLLTFVINDKLNRSIDCWCADQQQQHR